MVFNQQIYLQAVDFFQQHDPKIHSILVKHGYLAPLPQRNLFATLVGTIIGQRIRFNLARQQRKKLYLELGTDNFTIDDLINRGILFLQDHEINQFGMDDIINYGLNFLNQIGIDQIRCQVIKDLVMYLKTEDIELLDSSQLNQLKKIKGIKDWTINCTKIMHDLNNNQEQQEDCLLYQDLIIRRGIQKLYGIINESQIIELSKKWSPWGNIVTWYLWKEFT